MNTDQNIEAIASSVQKGFADLANAITPVGAAPAMVDGGVFVASLTEAVISVADALNRIAIAIEEQRD